MHKVCSLVLVLGGINAALGAESEVYVTEADKQVMALADDRMQLYCDGSGFRGSVNGGYLGGGDVALTVLSKAQSTEEVPDVFMEEYGVGWLIQRALAIVMAAVTLVFCLLFCLFSLCRCCAYERPTDPKMKTYAACVIAVVMLGLLICVFRSLSGYWAAHDGLYNAQCTSVTLLDTLLRGEKNGDYRGLVPVLEEFRKAENTLDDDSQFMQGVNQVLDLTDSIRASAMLAADTLALLEAMMRKNKYPKTSSGEDLFHECRFCTAVGAKLAPAMKLYKESPAAMLASGREETTRHLTPEKKAEFKKELRANAAKIVEVKDSAIRMISPMLKDDGIIKRAKEREQIIEYALLGVVLLASISALILATCAGISVYRFTYHEMDPDKGEKENPYNKNIHKYAHSTWCCGFFHVFLVLLIAGLIFVVAAPLSSVCVLMDELDSDTMKQIAPALGMDPDSDEAESVPAIIDNCLHPTEGEMEAYLLDLLFTTENGQRVTQRDKITAAVSGSLNPRFAALSEGSAELATPLATADEFKELASVLSVQQIDSMLTGATSKLRTNDDYADAAIPKVGLLDVLGSSIACEDFTVPAEMASQSGEKIPGVNSLKAKLTALGAQDPGGADCLTQVACPDGGEAYERAACHAANRLIDLKKKASESIAFQCDIWEAPDGSECDPLNMESKPGLDSVIWSKDCLFPDGTMKRKVKTCSMDEFATYVQKFEPRIKKVLERLDDQMYMDQPHIGATMTMLMNKHVIARTEFIANGITCRFFAEHYQELINGFCYQGVYGVRTIAKSYTWCAALSMLLVLSMYAVWCRAKGNIENWKEDRTQYQALLQKQKDAEEAKRRKQNGEEEERWILGDADDDARRVTAPTFTGPPGRSAAPDAAEES